MDFGEALRAYVSSELPDGAIIEDVVVRWDNGDRWDPTYGDQPNEAPEFSVTVWYRTADGVSSHVLDIARTFSALLLGILQVSETGSLGVSDA